MGIKGNQILITTNHIFTGGVYIIAGRIGGPFGSGLPITIRLELGLPGLIIRYDYLIEFLDSDQTIAWCNCDEGIDYLVPIMIFYTISYLSQRCWITFSSLGLIGILSKVIYANFIFQFMICYCFSIFCFSLIGSCCSRIELLFHDQFLFQHCQG